MTDIKKMGEIYKILNPEDNGGETVAITIGIFDNGDLAHGLTGAIFTIGEMTLQSYSNSASMSLPNISPEFLRELADELEAAISKAEATYLS